MNRKRFARIFSTMLAGITLAGLADMILSQAIHPCIAGKARLSPMLSAGVTVLNAVTLFEVGLFHPLVARATGLWGGLPLRAKFASIEAALLSWMSVTAISYVLALRPAHWKWHLCSCFGFLLWSASCSYELRIAGPFFASWPLMIWKSIAISLAVASPIFLALPMLRGFHR